MRGGFSRAGASHRVRTQMASDSAADGMGWLALLQLLLVARAPFSAHHVNHIAGVLIDTRPPISDALMQPLHSLLRYFRLQGVAYLISI